MSKIFKSAGFPAITLNNGLTVVNYSSPHPYTFDTGEVLPACGADLVQKHSLVEKHVEVKNPGGWTDVRIRDKMQDLQIESLRMIAKDDKVDVILVPYRVKVVIPSIGPQRAEENKMVVDKTRVCRIEDRINKLVSSTKFCK